MNGLIIGAGIGGLTTAIALQRKGIQTELVEAAEALAPIGAGILLPPNALAILARYGLLEQLENAGHSIDAFVVADAKGRLISRSPATYKQGNRHYRTVAIHRGLLQKILLDSFHPEAVTLGHRCRHVASTTKGAEASFENGAIKQADFLIAADGLHSSVRKVLFPDSRVRYSGQICWRGIANTALSGSQANQLTELWGQGTRFGFVPIAERQVYWYTTKLAQSGHAEHAEDSVEILRLFQEFGTVAEGLIESTPTGSIIRCPLSDLKPLPAWSSGSVVLLGDAAHAATPNLGQGGAQAIEDSYVLAEKLASEDSVARAFRAFRQSRIAKVTQIVNASRHIGQITNLKHPWACASRNQMARMSASIIRRQQAELFTLS